MREKIKKGYINTRLNKKGYILSFFPPDCTVGPGVTPDHALAYASARGLYHRLGIPRLAEISMKAGHPSPKERFEILYYFN